MKKLTGILYIVILFVGCQENDAIKNDFTGNESIYPLHSGSTYPVNGNVIFKEKKDGNALITIELSGIEGDLKHPVHLHLGNISAPGASISALLNPVMGKTGISETLLTTLADESLITYQQLIQLDACVKVHLSDAGPDKNVILAGGNIGTAAAKEAGGGRTGISVCKSE